MEALRNLKVLSLEQATVVPYLTYRLAMDGVEVIRLEHPVYGDPNRMIGENVLNEERMNAYFLCINAGKKALTLNLADPKGRGAVAGADYKNWTLISSSPISSRRIIRNSVLTTKPSRLPRKISYGWASPVLVPDSNEGAYDPILQARSGLMELTGEPDGDPQVLGIPLPDMGTSEHAYGLLMKALFNRAVIGPRRTNRFVHVRIIGFMADGSHHHDSLF